MKIKQYIEETEEAFIFECELNGNEGVIGEPVPAKCALLKEDGKLFISAEAVASFLGYENVESLMSDNVLL